MEDESMRVAQACMRIAQQAVDQLRAEGLAPSAGVLVAGAVIWLVSKPGAAMETTKKLLPRVITRIEQSVAKDQQ